MPNNHISTTSVSTVKTEDIVFFLKEIDLFLFEKLPELHIECKAKIKIDKLLDAIEKISSNRVHYAICVNDFAKEIRNQTKIRASHIANRTQSRKTRLCIGSWPAVRDSLENSCSKEELLLIAEQLMDEAFMHLSELYIEADYARIKKSIRATRK